MTALAVRAAMRFRMAADDPEDAAAPRFSREVTGDLPIDDRFARVDGEEELVEVVPDLPDVIAELDRAGRYEDGPLLGQGGMGEVRLRMDRRIGRSVATKIMHAHVENQGTSQRFLREARVQGQLEHPSIVPVYDVGIEDGRLWFTMKRVRGQTLARVLHGLAAGDATYAKRFPRRRLLSSYLEVCRAVHHAHTRGILHRDLKPSNVMLGEQGEVYVLDWGLARTFDRGASAGAELDRTRYSLVSADPSKIRGFKPNITKPGNLLGTLAYMAPEQARAELLDARADIYALGVILFEILTLRRFREDASYVRVVGQIMDGVVARPSEHVDIDAGLDALCVNATMVEREERIASALELAEGIERWLDESRDAEAEKRVAERIEAVLEARPVDRVRASGSLPLAFAILGVVSMVPMIAAFGVYGGAVSTTAGLCLVVILALFRAHAGYTAALAASQTARREREDEIRRALRSER